MSDYLLGKEQWIKKDSITVGELIEILKSYPKKMKVMTTWESTLHSLQKKNVYVSVTGSLYLDADENFYKEEFAKDPKENE